MAVHPGGDEGSGAPADAGAAARAAVREQRRSDNEALYRELAENSADWMWAIDLNGRLTYSNRRLAEILGVTCQQVAQADALWLVHPDDQALFLQTLERAYAQRCGWEHVVVRWRRRDGEYRMLDSCASPRFDAGGELIGFQGGDRDVTDLVRQHAEIRAVRNTLRATLEAMPDGVFEVDLQGRFIAAHSANADEFAVEPGCFIGRLVTEVLPPDAAAVCMAALDEAVAKGRSAGRQFSLDVHGDTQWHELSVAFRPGLDDVPPACVFVSRNVTARRQAERQRDLLTEALRQSAVPMSLHVGEGRIDFVNDAFCRLFGYAEAEIRGQHVAVLAPEGSGDEQQAIVQAIQAQGHWAGEVLRRSKHGEWIPVYLSASLVRSPDGLPRGVSSSLMDLRPIKEQQRALAVSEARHRMLLDHSADMVTLRDASGRLVYANPVTTGLLGYAVDELMAIDQAMPDQLVVDVAGLHRSMASLQPLGSQRAEVRLRRKDGTFVWCDMTALALPDGGHLVTFRDLTERKAFERATEEQQQALEREVRLRTADLQRARDAAQAASVAKSAFLANMSHEIRTPLNAITGMSHLLRLGGLSPRQAEQLDKLEAAGEHLLSTINAILELSKIESGKFDLRDEPVQIEAIVGNVLAMTAERAREKSIRQCSQVTLPRASLRGDSTRLQQALLNYVANAVKFTPGGEVTVRAFPRDETETAVRMRFEVADTGIGIDPQALGRLFAPFEQADNTTTRQFGGTGLGLAITRKLAGLMGGDVGADALAGGGSLFWFEAWLKKGPADRVVPARPHDDAEQALRRDHAGRCILLAEDDATNLEVAAALLRSVGLTVRPARDGEDVLRLHAEGGHDLVLMDVQMPVMDGLEATRRLRRLPQGRQVPIVAITANAFETDRQACLEAGMDDFLTKPFKSRDLFEMLLRWLDRGPTSTAARGDPPAG